MTEKSKATGKGGKKAKAKKKFVPISKSKYGAGKSGNNKPVDGVRKRPPQLERALRSAGATQILFEPDSDPEVVVQYGKDETIYEVMADFKKKDVINLRGFHGMDIQELVDVNTITVLTFRVMDKKKNKQKVMRCTVWDRRWW